MRKKSIEEKVLLCTNRLDKVRKGTLYTVHDVPKPQPYLTKAGKKIYNAIAEHLILHEALCKVDSFYMSLVAHNLDLYNRMATYIEDREAECPNSGYFQTFPNGVVQNSPEFNMMNKAFDIAEKGCRALGMTVKGRDTILAFSKKGEDESEDEFGLN